ncbi:MAG TPA: hypothetical protein VN281_14990 [Verrucomicrobiae bacterium]|jgi:hypothetical protein|nr:hypothetical protein [Verrucomicrobiae bacterium]
MIRNIGKITLAGLLAAIVVGVPIKAAAQDQTKPATPATPAAPEKKVRPTTFMGKLGEIDKTAKSFTVEEKEKKLTISVNSETKFYKNDNDTRKPSTLEEGVVGQEVTGSYMKGDDGKMMARNVYWGGRGGKKKKKTEGDDSTATPAPK